jgi:hypothetical protein
MPPRRAIHERERLVQPNTPESHGDCSAARLFDQLWLTMIDILGGPATATLLRRSIKRAAVHHTDLNGFVIKREGFEYVYEVPPQWGEARPAAVASLREVAHELTPLLVELTGHVVVRRLEADAELKRCRILFLERTR